ncbi:MAG: hypothetical protein CAK86_03830 [Opitutia bacterium AMD-G1]|nr:MAG: hypothetical protein CAK86_03830 [Opitutae bacterium AMD-G1]
MAELAQPLLAGGQVETNQTTADDEGRQVAALAPCVDSPRTYAPTVRQVGSAHGRLPRQDLCGLHLLPPFLFSAFAIAARTAARS